MPYIIRKFKDGFKVCKRDEPNTCFSKKGLPENRAKRQLKAIGISEAKGGAIPKDKKLYESIKEKVYKEQPKHSLYRSARVAKEYKKKGGEYEEDGKEGMNIPIWFDQKWITLNEYVRGNIKPCGSSNTEKLYNEYPLCRPLEIAKKLTKSQIKKMIEEKNKLKEKPLITKKLLDTDKFNIKPTKTGMGKDKFIKQLEKLGLSPETYLEVARRVAKREGYDPSKLSLSLNHDNKLKYESPEGLKHFGKAGYGDYIIWLFNEINGKVPKGYANQKRRVFRKSHSAMSRIHNLGKYSPNELAINILW